MEHHRWLRALLLYVFRAWLTAYDDQSAEDQWTLKENREAFSRIQLRPRVLIDVSHVNMSTSVLGYNVSIPIMIAPTALHKMAHPEGELASARAAAAAGIIMPICWFPNWSYFQTLSSWSSFSIEEVNSPGPGISFFQLSVFRDRNLVRQLVRRAEKAGYKAIVLTVDASWFGCREADVKNRRMVLLLLHTMQVRSTALSWKDIKWLQEITSLPILVKGILTAEDARSAIECGAAGIIVSNHGGRQLDYVPATISCLEEVVREAKGHVPVFLDGGIRRGTDIGRPVLFALAVDGEAGVGNALQMLRDELEVVMARL
ncbi:hypothetical protein EJB05_38269 [Eragrostis curvula]|uniref:(S)-2-hydroxy-acid oxidase n=1 Tax=Eragrostis curvula TaxID=38414 RepID=A0A5J9TTQ0_9POAL|nr:hypothetical protein EJB05_38269 [Eragrostis curvula]